MGYYLGEVIVDNKIVGYFEYHSVPDLAATWIFDSPGELAAAEGDVYRKCECDPIVKTPAFLYTEYASGFHWASAVCLKCRDITGDTGWEDDIEGHPIK